jgi:restriction endonuclease S subunit
MPKADLKVHQADREFLENCFDNLYLILPPLYEQKAIAEVLSSLDDKINLLQRNNKILEQLAETIFRKWFVEEAEKNWEEKTIEGICLKNCIRRNSFNKSC